MHWITALILTLRLQPGKTIAENRAHELEEEMIKLRAEMVATPLLARPLIPVALLIEAESKGESEAKSDIESDIETESESETESDIEAESDIESDAKSDTESDADTCCPIRAPRGHSCRKCWTN